MSIPTSRRTAGDRPGLPVAYGKPRIAGSTDRAMLEGIQHDHEVVQSLGCDDVGGFHARSRRRSRRQSCRPCRPTSSSVRCTAEAGTRCALHNDFIELFNRGRPTVSLAGGRCSMRAQTGAGHFAANPITTLSGSLAPGQYYLVQQASGHDAERCAAHPGRDRNGQYVAARPAR